MPLEVTEVREVNESDGSVGGDIDNDVENDHDTEEPEETDFNSSIEINNSTTVEADVDLDDKTQVLMLDETKLDGEEGEEEEKKVTAEGIVVNYNEMHNNRLISSLRDDDTFNNLFYNMSLCLQL